MVGPGLGIPVGLSTATVGSVLAWAGSVDFWGPTPNNQEAIAGGTLLIGAGLATFIYSSVKLSFLKANKFARPSCFAVLLK